MVFIRHYFIITQIIDIENYLNICILLLYSDEKYK